MKLQISVFILYFFLLRIHVNSKVPTKCTIKGIDDELSWNIFYPSGKKINDTTPAGTEVFSADATGITSIETTTVPHKYFDADFENGKFIVKVTDNFANYDEHQTVNGATYTETFSILCGGDETNTLNFRIEINDINSNKPEFLNLPYDITIRLPLREGDVIPNSIVARDIDFTNTEVNFKLSANDFLSIKTGTPFNNGKNYPAILTATRTVTSLEKQDLTITATDNGTPPLPSDTTITLIPDAISEAPSFEHPLYKGTYTTETGITLDRLKLTNSYIADNKVKYTLEDDVNGIFDIQNNPDNSISIVPKTTIGEELFKIFYIALTVKAQHEDQGIKPGYAVVIINLPQKELPECSEDLICPDSCPPVCVDCPFICSEICPISCSDDCPFTCSEDCPITCSEDCPITCSKDCPPEPTVCSKICPVKCSEDCPPEPVQCSEDCPVKCSIDCPVNCEETCPCEPTNCPDPEWPINCSECPTIPPPGPTPEFTDGPYSVTKSIDFVGTIIKVQAVVEDGAVLTYGAKYNDANLETIMEINPSTGEIRNTQRISPGKYLFTVTAKVEATGNIGYSSVYLTIDSLPESCVDPDKQFASYALIVKHLMEETIFDDILPIVEISQRPTCRYSIFSQLPSKGFFSIATDGKLQCVEIDRDDEEFYSSYGSQVQLILDIQCDEDQGPNVNILDTSFRNDSVSASKFNMKVNRNTAKVRDTIFAEDIPMSLTRTVLHIIIDDDNDNVPVFDPDIPSYIGYPTSDLASKIMPPNVITLKATDRDIGENAEILYRITSDYFLIHKKSGAVYPKDKILDDLNESQLKFTAYATDRNGLGNSSVGKTINVKLLSEGNIIVLTIKRALLDDVPEILTKLRSATSSNIHVLHSAVIPSPVQKSRLDNIILRRQTLPKIANVDGLLRLYIYALDTDNKPMESEKLLQIIEGVTLPWNKELSEFDQGDCTTEPTENPTTTKCPVTTECPECPTIPTPTPGPGVVPQFENTVYSFTIGPRDLPSWEVKATVDPPEDLEYGFIIDDPDLQSHLHIDKTTGIIKVQSHITPSNYRFTVYAEAPSSTLRGYTTISLVVTALATECPIEEVKAVANSLNVISLEEEKKHINILPLDNINDQGCTFSLESELPKKGFEITAENGLTCGPIDRDDKDFYEQFNSQVQLELELHCPPVSSKAISPTYMYENSSFIGPRYYVKKLDTKENGKYLVLTGNIKSSLTRTTVSIIFKDINDNKPIFDVDTPSIIGYPTSELASQILPPSVITMKATDLDIGENAEIKYELENEDIFQIHPVTGVVYPKIKSLDSVAEDKLFFTAIATDRNGEGLSSDNFVVQVKLLSSKHITVITIKNALLEDHERIIAQLSEKVQHKIYVLNAAVLPISGEESKHRTLLNILSFRQLRADSDESHLRLVVYGFNEKDEPIENEQLIEAIEKSGSTWDLNANEMTNLGNGNDGASEDVTGYIVAVSILSVLIAVIIGGVFIVWWFIIRPKQNEFRQSHIKLIEEESTPPPIQKNIWSTESEKPKEIPVASSLGEAQQTRAISLGDLLDGNKSDSFETRNPTVSFVKLEDKEDKEEQKTSDGPTRKKSVVTFNENVEKITIEKEENENEADEKAELD